MTSVPQSTPGGPREATIEPIAPIIRERVAIYQIIYSEETARLADPGFHVLDNRANPRPDWWEYWPIRQYLLGTPLNDDTFYGFLSPRFRSKTGLEARTVIDFVGAHAAQTDVITFSPQVDMGAFFLNLFEQNELFDPGFVDISQRFFDTIVDLLPGPCQVGNLLMDSRQIVVSNYFAARPAFWRRWLAINERLFALCEASDTCGEVQALQRGLLSATTYKGAERKVFLSERIASTLLACEPQWRVKAWNPFSLAWSASRLNQFPHEAVLSDALKLAARETGHPQYLAAFAKVRQLLQQP